MKLVADIFDFDIFHILDFVDCMQMRTDLLVSLKNHNVMSHNLNPLTTVSAKMVIVLTLLVPDSH